VNARGEDEKSNKKTISHQKTIENIKITLLLLPYYKEQTRDN